MAHDVFISHATQDKAMADAVCATLEQAGVRCWIAPRDIPPGSAWGASIVDALKQSRLMVVVFSGAANTSQYVQREVGLGVDLGLPVLPFRIDSALPEGSLQLHLGSLHWLDAMAPPIEAHLRRLTDAVLALLRRNRGAPLEPAPQPNAPTAAPPAPTPVAATPARFKPSPRVVVAGVLAVVALGWVGFQGGSGLSGTYESAEDGSTMSFEFKGGGKVTLTMRSDDGTTETNEATYIVDGNNVTIQGEGGIPLVLVRDGDVLQASMFGQALRFEKK